MTTRDEHDTANDTPQMSEGDLIEQEYAVAVKLYKKIVANELKKLSQAKSDVEKICAEPDEWLREQIKMGLLKTVFNIHNGQITGVKASQDSVLHKSFTQASARLEQEVIELLALDSSDFRKELQQSCKDIVDVQRLTESYISTFTWAFERKLRDKLEEKAKADADIAAEIFAAHHAKNHGWAQVPSLDFVKERLKNGQEG